MPSSTTGHSRRCAAPLASCWPSSSGRAVLAWATERAAHRASASAKSELRHSATEHIAALGPAGLEHQENGQLTVLVTTGIDALDGYFSRYLPQLFLAVIVPVTVIAVVAGADWVSAVLIAVSVPLIPSSWRWWAPRRGPARRPACGRSSGWPATSSTWWPGCPP